MKLSRYENYDCKLGFRTVCGLQPGWCIVIQGCNWRVVAVDSDGLRSTVSQV